MTNYIKILLKLTVLAIMLFIHQPAIAIDAGEVVGKHIFGLAHDYQGDPVIIDNDPLIYANDIESQRLQIDDSVFEVALFNNEIGSVYLTKIDKKSNKYLNTQSLDLSQTQGTSEPFGPILTSWNSVLFSEASLANAAKQAEFSQAFKNYYKNDESMINPYNYGWINELVVFDETGNAKVIKNYAMGRVSASQIVAMPDNRTFYMLDARHSGNIYVFIADKEKTMTAGTLYTMFNKNGAVEYLNIGDASSLKLKFRLKQASFDEIFSYKEPSNRTCPAGYGFAETVMGEECLKIKTRYKKYVGKFEPVRFTALAGVKPYAESIKEISLVEKESQLIILTNQGHKHTLSLAPNTAMKSDYVAEVRK